MRTTIKRSRTLPRIAVCLFVLLFIVSSLTLLRPSETYAGTSEQLERSLCQEPVSLSGAPPAGTQSQELQSSAPWYDPWRLKERWGQSIAPLKQQSQQWLHQLQQQGQRMQQQLQQQQLQQQQLQAQRQQSQLQQQRLRQQQYFRWP